MSTTAKWISKAAVVVVAVFVSLVFAQFAFATAPMDVNDRAATDQDTEATTDEAAGEGSDSVAAAEPGLADIDVASMPSEFVPRVRDIVAAKHQAQIDQLNEPFYVLVLGGDTRTNTLDGESAEPPYGLGRSDTMMLMRVDAGNHNISLLTVPRDTVYGEDGLKINMVLNYQGPEGSIDAVENLTGVRAKYYVATDFSRFSSLINDIGGVDVNVPFPMGFRDILNGGDINLEEGDQHLDGPSALVFSRIRKAYLNDEEACRQIQDRQVVRSIIEAACSDPASMQTYLKAFANNIETNMPDFYLNYYVKDFVNSGGNITFQSGTGPYVGGFNEENQWGVYPEPDTWNNVAQVFTEGGDPTEVVPLPTIEREF